MASETKDDENPNGIPAKKGVVRNRTGIPAHGGFEEQSPKNMTPKAWSMIAMMSTSKKYEYSDKFTLL